ncbi:MAG: tetratricopeptide repeat protein [Chitinivibrionales bacterium]|nr:tetratricopeptide repeat protein [Chitinivibrionales bacterium]
MKHTGRFRAHYPPAYLRPLHSGKIRRTIGAIVLIAGGLAPLCAATGGLLNEFLVSNQWRQLFGIHSPLTNPAFMTEEDYASVRGVFALSPDQVAHLWETGYIMPVGLRQSIGLSVVAENGISVPNGIWDPATNTISQGANSQNNNICALLSYAVNPWKQLSLGINVKMLSLANFGAPITAFSPDIALTYRLLRDPALGNHVLGLMYSDPVTVSSTSNVNSGTLRINYHSTYLENLISADAQYDIMDFSAQSSDFVNGTALTQQNLLLDIGFWPWRLFEVTPYAGFGKDGVDFWGIGLGLNAIQLNSGRDFAFTYQFRDDLANGLALSHSLYFRVGVGKHREENFALKLVQVLDFLPNDLYTKAMILYSNGKYWDAYCIFAQINANYPTFFKADKVLYYMGECLEALDMRNVARVHYDEAIADFPSSDVSPRATLGLMRLSYRQNDHLGVTNQYALLTAAKDKSGLIAATPDSVLNHGRYLMAQTFFKQKNYTDAVQMLRQIPVGHPDFPFAQHTMAVIQMIQGLDTTAAISALTNSIVLEPKAKAETDLNGRSFLLMGYLYYEQGALSKAVRALQLVAPASVYYEDALLGLGWSAIREKQWDDCIKYGQQIASAAADMLPQAEGGLIEAYGRMLQKDYAKASDILDQAKHKLDLYEAMQDSLAGMRAAYQGNRASYDSLGAKFVEFARKGELKASDTTREVERLHAPQIQIKEKLDEYSRFMDHYQRLNLFGKNLASLKEDVDYARATLAKVHQQTNLNKTAQEGKNKEQELQNQIDKAKEKLEKLQKESK